MSKYLKLRKLLKKESLYDKLFNCVDDYEIYCTFIGEELDLGETTNSPIRGSDDFPSFALYLPTRLIDKGYDIRPDAIWFKDLATGLYGDVIKFVRHFAAFHYGVKLDTSYEVIKFIDQELSLNIFSGNSKEISIKRKKRKLNRVKKEILYKSRRFTKRDLEYWSALDLNKKDLKHFNVLSTAYLLDSEGRVKKEFKRNELAFIYPFFDKEKLYQPEATRKFKFRNTCPGNDYRYYQGFQQLEGHDKLIITKSYKDVMVFWKYFNKILGIKVDVIAPHAESIELSQEFIDIIKKDYKEIIVVTDFDLAGVKFANKLRKKEGFNIKFVSTNRVLVSGKYKVLDKDISDFRNNHTKKKTKKLLKSWDI